MLDMPVETLHALRNHVHIAIDARQVAVHGVHIAHDPVEILVQHGDVIDVDEGEKNQQQ